MNRILTNAFPDVARISVNSWSPPVDIQETDDSFMIEADMPGVRPEDVTVDLQGKELRIGGEYGTAQQPSAGSDQQGIHRAGRFRLPITLPGEVTSEPAPPTLNTVSCGYGCPRFPRALASAFPCRPAGQTSSTPASKLRLGRPPRRPARQRECPRKAEGDASCRSAGRVG